MYYSKLLLHPNGGSLARRCSVSARADPSGPPGSLTPPCCSSGALASLSPTVEQDRLGLHPVTTGKPGKVSRFVLNDPGPIAVP